MARGLLAIVGGSLRQAGCPRGMCWLAQSGDPGQGARRKPRLRQPASEMHSITVLHCVRSKRVPTSSRPWRRWESGSSEGGPVREGAGTLLNHTAPSRPTHTQGRACTDSTAFMHQVIAGVMSGRRDVT